MRFFKYLLIISFLYISSFQNTVAQIHWESMVLESDTWKYLAATAEPASNWYQNSFDDTAWKSGMGGIGYADGDDKTVISNCNSLYMRRSITLPDVSIVKDLILDIDYDDGFVLYINGVECARSSNVTGSFPAFNAGVTTHREALMYSGGSPERYQLNPSMLQKGNNTFAVHILNERLSSSDMSARVFVHAKINYNATLYSNVPTWFTPPVNNQISNLPLIFIDTKSQTIIQNTKIMANMKVLNNASGENNLSDTDFEYNGDIGIEIRGNSSAGFPKKSYTVETRFPDGTNLNFPLLGMPAENDWVFHGPYADKSLMRNVLAYNLGNKTGKWSPRTRFFELYINGVYSGVYVLVEKIKIDKDRLDLANLKPTDNDGDQVTGGYIMKIDRPEATDIDGVDYWISPYRAPTRLQQKVYMLHHHPKGDSLTEQQRTYIKNYITDFENAMYSTSYKDRSAGYYPYVDIASFVDYYIITELSRNLDGYRISTFIHKDKDSKGGKLTMGPYWDYNICFGNANFFSAGNTAGWVIDGMGDADAYAMPFWWQKLRLDPYFNSLLKRRWNVVKNDFINTNYINNLIDSCAYELRDAQVRNFQKWNILNTYVWPNNYVGGTYANELTYLKNWIRDRINWMDAQIQPIEDIIQALPQMDEMPLEMVVYPNPFIEDVQFKCWLPTGGDFEIQIRDISGRLILQTNQVLPSGLNTVPMKIAQKDFPAQFFSYQIFIDGKLMKSGKIIRQ